MAFSKYLDCELFLTGREQARLSVAGRDYTGRPVLDGALERRLLETALEPVRYGTLLFAALFPGNGDELLIGYRESLALARHEGQRLRFRLHIAATAPFQLHELHWELLYDPGQRLAFSRSQEMAFSRYLGSSFDPGTAVVGRPRLLIGLSCPQNLAEFGLPAQDHGELKQSLARALQPLAEMVSYEFLEPPITVERIRDRLVEGKFHALHLHAHGLLGAEQALASLVLEGDDQRAVFIEEELFSEVFEGQRDLRLVTLIACHSGAPTKADPFSGLGPALVRRNIPAVVAMRRQITLEAATRFVEHFYRNLARGGQVDVAVNESRHQLYLADPESPEWGTPALSMHLREGLLWETLERADRGALEKAPLKEVVLRTILVSRLLEKRAVSEGIGHRHLQLIRGLLRQHGGREIESGEDLVLLFERPIQAVQYALVYHRALEGWAKEEGVDLQAGVGIHLGEVVLGGSTPLERSREGKAVEVVGAAQKIVVRLLQLAKGRQTLLTRAAFDVARQGTLDEVPESERLLWLAHGEYVFRGLEQALEIFEVGVEGFASLEIPEDSEAVRRARAQDTILGWRPAPALVLPQRPHWVVKRKLGAGGFGEVWLAAHAKTGEQRVFKFCYEASRLRALQREITLFRLLKEELGNRDDIARILDWNFEEAPYFIESEYAEDGNLLEWAEEQGGIENVPLEQRLEIVAKVATALAAAHSVGVLHKDVKPANVLISQGGERQLGVRLCDFGIGTLTERNRLVASGITMLGMTTETEESSTSQSGTRLYMAPELVEGKGATLQADIYALGVMLYQMISGDFSRALAPGWRRHVEDELLCEDIALVVDGSPTRRLGNALRIAERLRALEDRRAEREAERRAVEEARQVRKELARSRRRRKVVGVMIGALVLLAAASIVFSILISQEADRANREAETTRHVLQFMEEMFRGSGPKKAKDETVTLREILDQSAERMQSELAEQPLVQARLLETIGGVYTRLRHYELAKPLLLESLRIRVEHFGEEHLASASSQSSLASFYSAQGLYEEAEELYQESLAIRKRILGPNHQDVAQSLNDLGILYWIQGRYNQAEPLFVRALEIRKTGTSELNVAQSLNNLASLYWEQGRFDEVQPLYEEALELREKALGPNHTDVAESLNNLATSVWASGRGEEAKELYHRALKILETRLGTEHPEVASTLNNIAILDWNEGHLEEAERLFLKVLAVQKESLGVEHPSFALTLTDLADLYREQGRYTEAEPFYQQAVKTLEKTLGREHVYLGNALRGFATLRREQQRYTEAASLFQRALKIHEKEMKQDHPELQTTVEEYAACLRKMEKEGEAVRLEKRFQRPVTQ